MKIKTLILSAVLASSSIFGAEPQRLTAANLEAHNRLHPASTSIHKTDSDQSSNPSTIAAGKEALPIARTVAHSDTRSNTSSIPESSAEESSWSLSGIGKSILNQVSSPAKKLGSFLVEKTAKHGALIAAEAVLTKIIVTTTDHALSQKAGAIINDEIALLITATTFLGAQTLFSGLFCENPKLLHVFFCPLVKATSIACQAAYMTGFCFGETALVASGINLLYMVFGETECSDFR